MTRRLLLVPLLLLTTGCLPDQPETCTLPDGRVVETSYYRTYFSGNYYRIVFLLLPQARP